MLHSKNIAKDENLRLWIRIAINIFVLDGAIISCLK